MAKIINKVAQGYQIIPRELILDSTISDRARFVYCFMASKPEDWDFLLEPMAKEIGYSKDTLRKYINELIDGGWLIKGEQDNTNGVFGAVCYELQPTKNTDTEKYRHGKNPTQHNIDNIQNTDIHSTNVIEEKKEIDKSISKKTKKSAVIDMSIVPPALVDVVKEWLEYKKERRETYKPKGFKVLVKHLVKYSQGDPNIAQRIIEQSMSCNYAGIFPLKDNANINNYDTGMIINGDRNELYEADKKNLW